MVVVRAAAAEVAAMAPEGRGKVKETMGRVAVVVMAPEAQAMVMKERAAERSSATATAVASESTQRRSS